MCMQNVIQDKRGFGGLGAVCACWEGVMQGLIRRDFCSAVNNSLKIWVNDTFDFQAALLTWAREWSYEWIRGFEKDVRVWQRPNCVCWSNIGIFFLYVHYELIPTALYVERVYIQIGHTFIQNVYTHVIFAIHKVVGGRSAGMDRPKIWHQAIRAHCYRRTITILKQKLPVFCCSVTLNQVFRWYTQGCADWLI